MDNTIKNPDNAESNLDGITTKDVAFAKSIEVLRLLTSRKQIDAMAFVFVTKGKASLKIDGTPISVRSHDMFLVGSRSNLSDINISDNFDCMVMALTREFIMGVISNVRIKWKNIFSYAGPPVAHLDETMFKFIKCYYHLLNQSKDVNGNAVNEQSIRHITLSLLEEIKSFSIRNGLIATESEEAPVRQSDVIFKRFITLANESLMSNSAPSRSIQHYADSLNVSAKYLTHVCKVCSGQTAKTLIDSMLIKRIEALLHSSDLTIKEIAMQLGFPDVSNFGRFVKAKLGESPRAIRARIEQR